MPSWFKAHPESDKTLPRIAAVFLAVAVAAAYWNSLRAPFLFDDAGAVVSNPTIRHLASRAVLAPPADGSTTTGRPVVNVSFALNYALGGTSVWGYHALNLLIHVLAGLTLFGIVRRTLIGSRRPETGDRNERANLPLTSGSVFSSAEAESDAARLLFPSPAAKPPDEPGHSSKGATAGSSLLQRKEAGLLAFAVALLWALHPLQTESVTCIAQRTESLMGLFYLLTLYGFIRAAEGTHEEEGAGGRGQGTANAESARQSLAPLPLPSAALWSGLSILCCLLGMATKEVMATAPLVVLLYDRTFVAGGFTAAWRQRRGFYFVLGATWLLLAWLVVGRGGGRGVAAGFGLGVSWWTYLLQQAGALVLYLKLSVWPHPLVLDYGTAVAHDLADVWWQGLILLTLLAGTVWALVRKPAAGFLGAWFFLILAPSSSVVPLVTQTMAEHRMYLPLAAVITGGIAGLQSLLRHLRATPSLPYSPTPSLPSTLTLTFTLTLGAALALLTSARNRDYRDALTIWGDTVAKYPQSARAQNNFALALQQHGRIGPSNDHFARAVALQPGYVTAHFDWGVALLDQDRVADAIAQFAAAVRLAPGDPDAQINLGNALVRARRAAEAIPHYEAALRIQPAADAHYDLGVALVEIGQSREAETQLRAALQLNANLPAAHFQLARLAEQSGRTTEAAAEFAETLRLAPDQVDAHRALGLLQARRGQLAPAAGNFRAVIRLQPGDADAHANLGNVLLLQGAARDAVAEYEEALRLRPGDERLRESLRMARDAMRR